MAGGVSDDAAVKLFNKLLASLMLSCVSEPQYKIMQSECILSSGSVHGSCDCGQNASTSAKLSSHSDRGLLDGFEEIFMSSQLTLYSLL